MTTNDEPLNRAREKRERPGWPLRINDRREDCSIVLTDHPALMEFAFGKEAERVMEAIDRSPISTFRVTNVSTNTVKIR